MGYGNFFGSAGLGMGLFGAWMGALFIPFVLWSLAWKGWALWRAAKNDSKVWFVVLLVVNTLGILDILYLFVFGKAKKASKKS
jgi:hypothetical protein